MTHRRHNFGFVCAIAFILSANACSSGDEHPSSAEPAVGGASMDTDATPAPASPITGGATAGGAAAKPAGSIAIGTGEASPSPASSAPAAGGTITPSIAAPDLPKPTGAWASIAAPLDKASQLQTLSSMNAMSFDDLAARSTSTLNESLGYDPTTAQWYDLIDASFGLSDSEHELYQKHGFVISSHQSFSTFFAGYESIYKRDLPVYVSADSILHAVHRSYDNILSGTESSYLQPTVESLITKLRAKLASSAASDNAKHDVGLLLGVTAGLLSDKVTDLDDEMKSFISKATAASGIETVAIFGVERDLDFSQFKPRGHYAGTSLERYFRAMMWLGRTELRLVDVDPHGARKLMRREIEDVLALGELFDSDNLTVWKHLDEIVGLFVGEPDYMSVPQIQVLRDALGIESSAELSGIDDKNLLATIDAGNFGVQRVASQLMDVADGMTTLPNSFALFGQRFTVDSEVMTKVVYPNTDDRRMMPNPLDVAFAAFGNDQALQLLKSEIDAYNYGASLGKARQLVEWHGPDYWESSMYTLWTDSLRQLSPNRYEPSSLPAVARTEAWGRRLLNTQLASWAELRHDTLLYVKQSYTGRPLCEYPDGYVDPYPGLFLKLKQLGDSAAAKLRAALPANSYSNAPKYFETLSSVADRLAAMATEELTGAPRTQADLDFLNDAVVIKTSTGCATVSYPSGWYVKLFYNGDDAMVSKPTIADVHTQPSDESGAPVGKVLHIGTGDARLMVVSVDSCQGPRAYAGVVSSYFEHITKDFLRLTDEEWARTRSSVPDVPWMKDLVAR